MARVGTNVSIMVEPGTRAEAKRIFDALAQGGRVSMPLQEMIWGAYYGALTDRCGVPWMA